MRLESNCHGLRTMQSCTIRCLLLRILTIDRSDQSTPSICRRPRRRSVHGCSPHSPPRSPAARAWRYDFRHASTGRDGEVAAGRGQWMVISTRTLRRNSSAQLWIETGHAPCSIDDAAPTGQPFTAAVPRVTIASVPVVRLRHGVASSVPHIVAASSW